MSRKQNVVFNFLLPILIIFGMVGVDLLQDVDNHLVFHENDSRITDEKNGETTDPESRKSNEINVTFVFQEHDPDYHFNSNEMPYAHINTFQLSTGPPAHFHHSLFIEKTNINPAI